MASQVFNKLAIVCDKSADKVADNSFSEPPLTKSANSYLAFQLLSYGSFFQNLNCSIGSSGLRIDSNFASPMTLKSQIKNESPGWPIYAVTAAIKSRFDNDIFIPKPLKEEFSMDRQENRELLAHAEYLTQLISNFQRILILPILIFAFFQSI